MSVFIEIKGGAWGKGHAIIDRTFFGNNIKSLLIKGETIPADQIVSVQLVTEDNKGAGIASAGGAVAGAILAGPVGLLAGLTAGALAGGHKKAGAVLTLTDGRQAVLFSDTNDILELIGVAAQNTNTPNEPQHTTDNIPNETKPDAGVFDWIVGLSVIGGIIYWVL